MVYQALDICPALFCLIMQIYENKSEYKKMSDAARTGYEEHYSLKSMTDEYEKVWEREYEKRYKD